MPSRGIWSVPVISFPLRAKEGGVLVRTGQTEGSVDLARLAGMTTAGVICEIMNEDGTMSRMPDLEKFAAKHGLKIATIADLVAYRLRQDILVQRAAEARVPTEHAGEFTAIVYTNDVDDHEHLALVKGDITKAERVLVRVHSECLTGDVFGSSRCDCGLQLNAAMQMIDQEGCGIILYMRQEGRGIGLVNKLKAYLFRTIRVWIPSRPISSSGFKAISGIMASGPRFSVISGSAKWRF